MNIDEKTRIFLTRSLGGFTGTATLRGDASDRSYVRVFAGTGSYVLCRDMGLRGARAAEYPYFIMHGLIRESGVRVPEIYSIDEGEGFILMQDLGDLLLEEYLKDIPSGDIPAVYRKVIDNLVRIQLISPVGVNYIPPLFDTAKLMQEFNFFIEHTLEGFFNRKLPADLKDELQEELRKVAVSLDLPHLFVMNHRDFHSRNIMVTGGDFFIIDFQDARMGLPQYDLASLIRDSYVRLGNGTAEILRDYYYHASKERGVHTMPREQFDHYFNLMAFQRNIKAAGSFGYLATVKKKSYFQAYLEPTFGYINDYVKRDGSLKRAWEIIGPLVCHRN